MQKLIKHILPLLGITLVVTGCEMMEATECPPAISPDPKPGPGNGEEGNGPEDGLKPVTPIKRRPIVPGGKVERPRFSLSDIITARSLGCSTDSNTYMDYDEAAIEFDTEMITEDIIDATKNED